VTSLEIAGLTIFILILFTGIFTIVIGIPGTVIILIDAILYAMFTGFEKIGIKIILILFIISLIAESIDFALGMAGAVRLGISRKAIWASVIGAFIAAAIMTPTLFGFGTITGTFLGGFAGIVFIELVRQSQLKPAFRTAYGAILAMFTGMLLKGSLAVLMTIITLTNIYS
jgi:uncharacterized protein